MQDKFNIGVIGCGYISANVLIPQAAEIDHKVDSTFLNGRHDGLSDAVVVFAQIIRSHIGRYKGEHRISSFECCGKELIV